MCMPSSSCRHKLESMPKNIFTLHGLWPSYSNGRRISDCNKGKDIKIEGDGSDIWKKMEVFWPSYFSSNSHFWTHEYNKHGYCYSERTKKNDPKDYFKYVMALYNKNNYDLLMLNAVGQQSGEVEYAVDELRNHIQKVIGSLKFDLACQFHNHKQYLKEIRFYYDFNLKPIQNYPSRSNCSTHKSILVEFLD